MTPRTPVGRTGDTDLDRTQLEHRLTSHFEAELSREIGSLRRETYHEIASLRAEMYREIGSLHSAMHRELQATTQLLYILILVVLFPTVISLALVLSHLAET